MFNAFSGIPSSFVHSYNGSIQFHSGIYLSELTLNINVLHEIIQPTPVDYFLEAILKYLMDSVSGHEMVHAMAQIVSRRAPTMEARVRTWVSPCGICGGQSGTGTGFL
jgi:hypothetical protein